VFVVRSRTLGEEEIQTTSVVDILQPNTAYRKRTIVYQRDCMKGSKVVELPTQ